MTYVNIYAMKRTTVYLEEEMDFALSQLAKRRQRAKAELLREALANFIAQQKVADKQDIPSWLGGGDSRAERGLQESAETEGAQEDVLYQEHLEREYESIVASYERTKVQP